MRGVRRVAGFAALLPIALSLAGCPATSLVRLDNEWAQTYRAKMQSIKDDDDYLATASNYEAQFGDISARAEEAGDEALAGDAPTAVGFYRIAVLAAWKSAELREDKVPELAAKGAATCDLLPNKSASQPRDCALFQFVESFARYDRRLRDMSALLAGTNSGPYKLPPAQVDAALALQDDIAGIFDKVGERRTEVSKLALPPSFHQYVNQNWKTVFCSTEKLRLVIFGSLGSESEKTRAVLSKDRQMQEALMAAKISVQCQ